MKISFNGFNAICKHISNMQLSGAKKNAEIKKVCSQRLIQEHLDEFGTYVVPNEAEIAFAVRAVKNILRNEYKQKIVPKRKKPRQTKKTPPRLSDDPRRIREAQIMSYQRHDYLLPEEDQYPMVFSN